MRLSFPPLKSLWFALALCAAAAAQAGPPAQLALSGAPAILISGAAMPAVDVTVEDSSGNPVTASSAAITLTLSGPSGFTVSASAPAAGGAASLTLAPAAALAAGAYTFTASSPSLASATAPLTVLAASSSLGSVAVGKTASQTVDVQLPAASAVASAAVLYQGAAGLDFTSGGYSCSPDTANTALQICGIDVIFAPKAPGLRVGAVELLNASGAILATSYISGVGAGAMSTYLPGRSVTVSSATTLSTLLSSLGNILIGGYGLGEPDALAMDPRGNLFIADWDNDRVVEVPTQILPGAKTVGSPVSWNLSNSDGLAIDGAGNLYSSDYTDNQLVEVTAAQLAAGPPSSGILPIITLLNGGLQSDGYTPVNPSILYNPSLLAVDAAGNLYVCDYSNNRVLVIPNENGALNPADAATVGSGLLAPSGVAVDALGNVYIADFDNDRVVTVPNQNGVLNSAAQTTVYSPALLSGISDVALDPAGDLLITAQYANNVLMIPNEGSVSSPALNPADTVTLDTSVNGPDALLLDPLGNIYVADTENNDVFYLDTQAPPTLAFGTSPVGVTTPGQSALLDNPGNVPLAVAAIAAGAGYQLAPITADPSIPNPMAPGSTFNTCSITAATGSLATGNVCALTAVFAPATTGTYDKSIAVTEGASTNQSSTAQSVPLTAVASLGQQTIALAPVANQPYAAGLVFLEPTASSAGVAVKYTVTGPATMTAGSLAITGAGTVAVTANAAAVASQYAAAPTASLGFTISQAAQSIGNFQAIGNQTYGAAPITLSATGTTGGAAITYTATGPATVAGSVLAITGAGTVTVTASEAANADYAAATPVSQTFTVAPASQTIASFAAIGNQAYGAAPITLSATGTTGGAPITYTATGPATVSGSVLTLTGAGSVTVTASEAANANYAAATPVSQTFTVAPGTQTIGGFAAIGNQTYGAAPIALSATGTAGGAPITYTVSGPATISGSTLTLTGAGSVTVTASEAANANYAAATPVSQTFTVAPAPQTISKFAAIGNQTYGAAPIALSATGTAGGAAVAYTATGPATVTGNTLVITGAGAVTVTASEAASGNYAAATPVSQAFTVARAPLAVAANNLSMPVGGPLPALTYTISGFVNGDTAATATSGAPLLATTATAASPNGLYPISIAAGSFASPNYTPAFASATLTVGTGQQTISFNLAANGSSLPYGSAPLALSASSNSGLPIVFAVSGAATLGAGNTVVFNNGVGAVTITASQVGGNAQPVTQSLTVVAAPQSFTFTLPATVNLGAAPLILQAADSSGLPISYAVAGPATLSGATLTATGPGAVTVTASVAASPLFTPVAPIAQTLTVTLPYAINTAITNNFNNQTLAAGSTVWFGSSFDAHGVQDGTIFQFQNAAIQFASGGQTYTVAAPNVTVTFSSQAYAISTTFNAATNTWQTVVPFNRYGNYSGYNNGFWGIGNFWGSNDFGGGEVFLDGASFTVPSGGLPANLLNLTWSGLFTSSTPGATIAWKWNAENYGSFNSNLNALAVKSNLAASCIWNSREFDEAGMPENYEFHQLGGGSGDGSGNSSDWSNVATVAPGTLTLQTIAFSPLANPTNASGTVSLSATATSGLAVQFTVVSGNASIRGNTLIYSGSGDVMIAANQPGNSQFAPAPTSTQTIVVPQPPPSRSIW